ncbi:hypothetical protein [Paenibacillus polymyxa]|uniref:hypothetical protein n=1 Tax=Paenibacillus polymyxa TaxID=1406 RepID=UPI002AB41044|nr:hypothetical protein [Paenibacillus polymyxa]MDY8021090.1 hypothetical protein [Paenibacillus polymyxa]
MNHYLITYNRLPSTYEREFVDERFSKFLSTLNENGKLIMHSESSFEYKTKLVSSDIDILVSPYIEVDSEFDIETLIVTEKSILKSGKAIK